MTWQTKAWARFNASDPASKRGEIKYLCRNATNVKSEKEPLYIVDGWNIDLSEGQEILRSLLTNAGGKEGKDFRFVTENNGKYTKCEINSDFYTSDTFQEVIKE